MAVTYSEIFVQNADFQRAVNLSLDQGSLALVDKYIPTTASATVLARYLKAIITPGNDRASILIGPYGKGKSHTLFVVLAMVSEYGEQADSTFSALAERLENVNTEAAELVRKIRHDKIRLLPIIVNDRYLDIRQAFMASVKMALASANLADIMPDNYFEHCLATIERWHKEFPSTYKSYVEYLKANGRTATDFETSLKQFDAASLSLFRECHKAILSGTEFDPLLESDVPTLYSKISEALRSQTEYHGIFVVFDEFGKYLESATTSSDPFKALQDLAEKCTHSKMPIMLLSCITHKAISEYASHLNQVQRNSFRTVEGRFEPIYFTSTFEGNFSLISGALGRNKEHFQYFINEHLKEYAHTIDECTQLGCFAGYESTVEQIVEQCFPMHPLTTLSLMKLSECAAQNERTFFTYLSDSNSPLAEFIRQNNGSYNLATVDMVYDYFHITIRENSYDPELRDSIIHADSLLPLLDAHEGKLIKAIVLFSMVADNCLLATQKVLLSALQWNEEEYMQTVNRLEQAHHIYTRRSDGVICMMRSTTENVRQDIEHEVSRRCNIDIAKQFAELRDPGFTIPRRYNDQHEMVRFFQNVFVSAARFEKYPSASFLNDYGFADGYIIYLLGESEPRDVQAVLQRWNDPRVAVILSNSKFTSANAVKECAAIKQLLEHPQDEVAAEELTYYFEDLLQMVNQTYASLFQKDTLLIMQDRMVRTSNISTEISTLCETKLYPACPTICHEMMNRSSISGQMKQTRAKVIDTVFNDGEFLKAYSAKTAEGAVIQAVLGHLQDEKMRCVTDEITAFVATCEDEKQPIQALYDKLTKAPYGMRKGVLPILLAYCLRDKHQSSVLYNNNQEIVLNGESLNALDDHYQDYELLVDKGSAEQSIYIQILHDKYTPDEVVPNIRNIFEAMRKVVRALPRSARANRKTLANEEVQNILQSVIDMRSLLIRFEGNPRDIVINQLPKCTGILCTNADCAQIIISTMDEMCEYTKHLMNGMKQIIRTRMNAKQGQTIRGTMTIWLQNQPTAHLNHSFSNPTVSLLNVIRCTDNHTDAEWMNMIAIALTGLPVEDWADRQIEEFSTLLDNALLEIESVQDSECDSSTGDHIQLSIGGMTLEQALPNQKIAGLASVAYDSIRSALNEFADSLSTDEKLLVLANLMLRVNE